MSISAFWLKIIAIIGMALQHTALIFVDMLPMALLAPMQMAGGMVFPIFAFLLVEGYRRTSSMAKYLLRIYLFAMLSQIPFMLLFGGFNILFTMGFGLIALLGYDFLQRRWIFWVLFLVAFLGMAIFNFDWAPIGLPIILMYRVIDDEFRRSTAPAAFAGIFLLLGVYLPPLMDGAAFSPEMLFPLGCFIAMPLIWAYNGTRGPSLKILFYTFYPAHLTAIAAIAYFSGILELPF